jgi:hypothetical protein
MLGEIKPFVKSERLITKIVVATAFQAQKLRFSRGSPPQRYVVEQQRFFDMMRRLNLRLDAAITGRAA